MRNNTKKKTGHLKRRGVEATIYGASLAQKKKSPGKKNETVAGHVKNVHPKGDASVHESAGRQKCLTCGFPLASPVTNRRIEEAMIAAIAMHALYRIM